MKSGGTYKNGWVLLMVMLAGVVIGGFIGKYLGMIPYMDWLEYGKTFGFEQPFLLDLEVISIQLGFTIKFSIAGIIGMILAVIVYRKM